MNDPHIQERLSRLGYTVDEIQSCLYYVRNRAGLRYTAMDKDALYSWVVMQESKQATDTPQMAPALYDPAVVVSLLTLLNKPLHDALDELAGLNRQALISADDMHYGCSLWASACHGFAFRLTALQLRSGMAQSFPILTSATHTLLRLSKQTLDHFLSGGREFSLLYDAWAGDFCTILLSLDGIMKDEALKNEDSSHVRMLAETITLMQVFLLEAVKLRTSPWE